MTDEQLEQWISARVNAHERSIAAMSLEQLRGYTRQLATQVVFLAADVGATDWPENLHLADVVEKHIGRMPAVRRAVDEATS